MWQYQQTNALYHGTKGKKWGYTNGVKNGKRTAAEIQKYKSDKANERGEAELDRAEAKRRSRMSIDELNQLEKKRHEAKVAANVANDKKEQVKTGRHVPTIEELNQKARSNEKAKEAAYTAKNKQKVNKNEGKVEITQKDIDAINFKNNPPEDYNPDLKKTVKNEVPGYTNNRGEFFSSKSGSSVKLQSWQSDIKYNEEKAAKAAKKAPSNFDNAMSSGKKKVDGLLKKLFK